MGMVEPVLLWLLDATVQLDLEETIVKLTQVMTHGAIAFVLI